MIVLGIESSCDDTGVGIVDDKRNILANIVASQIVHHKPYDGVVPEIAARAHLEALSPCIQAALEQANLSFNDIDVIAATTGPGLIGGLIVGSAFAKSLCLVSSKPFVSVNHLEAHALTVRLSSDVEFPYILLLVSGGHSQFLLVNGVGSYKLLGSTLDDAVGECFDKCAKLLGLGYPGGPVIETRAKNGNALAFNLPKPMLGRAGCDLSFSGLKTAVRTIVYEELSVSDALSSRFIDDMAASLQETIALCLKDRASNAIKTVLSMNVSPNAFVVSGGVGANLAVRSKLQETALSFSIPFAAPPVKLCSDNGVMIAWTGLERFRLGIFDPLAVRARPRWPVQDVKAI